MAGADLLLEKSTTAWLVLVADADLARKKNTAGWLADKPAESVGVAPRNYMI